MSVFEDIESGIEISNEQAINYFHKILKCKSFRLVNYILMRLKKDIEKLV